MNRIEDRIDQTSELYQAQLKIISSENLSETTQKLKNMASDLALLIGQANQELKGNSNSKLEGRIQRAILLEKKLHLHSAVFSLMERDVIPKELGKKILETNDINARNEKNGSTALMYVANKGTKEDVSNMLGLNADSSIQDKLYNHVLKVAINRDNPEVFSLLIKSMSKFDFLDVDGCTVVHTAAARGKTGILEILKETKIWDLLVGTSNFFGETPLDLAIRHKQDEAAFLLCGSKSEHIHQNRLYGINFIDINQKKLEANLKKFINLEKDEGVSTESIIQEGGQCNGWTLLHQYYFSIGKLEEYKEALEVLAKWDGNAVSLKEVVGLLECETVGELLRDLVNHLVVFHALSGALSETKLKIDQGDRDKQYHLISSPDSDRTLHMMNKSISVLADIDWTKSQLQELLEILHTQHGVVYDFGMGGAGGGHRTSLAITNEGKFHYYDSNHRSFLIELDKPESVVEMIYRGLNKLGHESIKLHWNSFCWLPDGETIPQIHSPRARKDSPNGFGDLHIAALCGDLESCKKLITKEEDVLALDRHGNMAIDYACMYGHYDIAALFVPLQKAYMVSDTKKDFFECKLFLPKDFIEQHLEIK